MKKKIPFKRNKHKFQKITTCGGKYYYDKKAADRVVKFFKEYLIHIKGKWAGQPFELAKWQQDEIIRPLFGWKRKKDGRRRFRTVWVEIPKKNGKSALASGLALYLLLADGESGAEIYSAATDKDQAKIVYDSAKAMLDGAPRLRKFAVVGKKTIAVTKTNSFYTAMSSDVPNKHGINPHAVLIDEVHAHKTPDLIDTLTDGSGFAREQPIFFFITTAGFDRNSICWEYHKDALKVLKDEKVNEQQLVCIYAADAKSNWRRKETWIEANPNVGISIDLEKFQEEFEKVKRIPRKQNSFKRLNLNLWTQQDVVWLNVKKWDEGACELDIEILRKYPCFVGLDLSSTIDLSSVSYVFKMEEGYAVINRCFIPSENIQEREETDAVAYRQWVDDGYIIPTEGNVIDYKVIEEEILAANNVFDIKEIGFDPYNATEIVQSLENRRLKMIPVRQGMLTMSPPTKHLELLVLKNKVWHEGSPVMRYMISNTTVLSDASENIKPVKKKSNARIDGVVSTIIGLERALRFTGKSSSIYNDREMRVA